MPKPWAGSEFRIVRQSDGCPIFGAGDNLAHWSPLSDPDTHCRWSLRQAEQFADWIATLNTGDFIAAWEATQG